MTMLVQPRHLKLFFAAREKNWELAAFQVNELRASFRRIGQTVPIYRTQDVNKAAAIMATQTGRPVRVQFMRHEGTQWALVHGAALLA